MTIFKLLVFCIFAYNCDVTKYIVHASSYYDVYDNDDYNDGDDRIRRTVDNCGGDLPFPKDALVDRIFPTSARISWNDVEEADSYAVQVYQPKSNCVRGESDDVTTSSVILRDLDADTSYNIHVIAHNVNGCSEATEVKFKTNPGSWKCAGSSSAPGKVQQMMIWNVTSTGASVTWAPAPRALFYDVSIDPPNPLATGTGAVYLESTQIKGLDPGTSQLVSVTPRNGNHKGEVASRELITSLENPQNFAVENCTNTYFKAAWDLLDYGAKYTLVLKAFDNEAETYPIQEYRNISSDHKYFSGLETATRYLLTLQAFNTRASSPIQSISFYTKLASPSGILISNVTSNSAFARWKPVEGATSYRVVLRDGDQMIAKYTGSDGKRKPMVYEVDETSYLLGHLESATNYELQIIASNDDTDSIPGRETVYSRLSQIRHLNVDADHVQDTSVVLRWEPVRGAEWYDVEVEPNKSGIVFVGEKYHPFRKIANLTPGTLYKFIVRAKNHPKFDTTSLPAEVEQFTRLSQPLNMTISYRSITDNSMRVTWSPVPHADSYLLLVYDCSGVDRRVGKVSSIPTGSASTALPEEYNSLKKYWTYHFEKAEPVKLICEGAFESIEHAIVEGEKKLPSTIAGQGRTRDTNVLLTKMRPNTRYEVVVVSGKAERQSDPSRLVKFTKLVTPRTFTFDERMLTASSVKLQWTAVAYVTFYQLDVMLTPTAGSKQGQMLKVRRENITATSYLVRRLKSSKNYTFVLTARNFDTSSFPIRCGLFTRLPPPPTLDVVPENLTTDSMLIQWTSVSGARYYNVSFTASGSRTRRGIPHSRTVTSPYIYLSDLTPNTYYKISIVARNKYTRSLPSSIGEFTELPTPTNFTAVNVDATFMLLSWDDVEGRKDFKLSVLSCESKIESFTEVVDAITKNIRPLAPNHCYIIQLKAINSDTQSEVTQIMQYTKLATPQRMSFIKADDDKLRLRWAPVQDAQFYSIAILPLFNESQPSTSAISDQFLTDVIYLKRTSRSRRNLPDGKTRSKRVRRSDDVNVDITSFIDYESVKEIRNGRKNKQYLSLKKGRAYPGLSGYYYINVTSSDVIFTQLHSSVKYRMTLKALNDHTDSLPVTSSTFTELKSPQQMEIRDVTNSTFLVKWRPVDKSSYYTVRIVSETRSRFAPIGKSQLGNTTGIEMKVEELEPDVNYTVFVVSKNIHVISKSATTWTITKLSPVGNFRVIRFSVKHDRFHVKWNPVAHATQYVITLSPPSETGKSLIVVANGATEETLRDLKYGTRYHVTVKAKNGRTSGMERDLVQFTKLLTPQDASIIEESVTSSNFTVAWLPVPNADRYKIEIKDRQDAKNRVTFVYMAGVDIGDLLAGRLYQVSIMAQNAVEGTFSDPVTVTSYTKLETPRDFNIKDDDITESSMIVTWSFVPLATEYIVNVGVESREGDHHRETRAFISKLHSASYYSITMKAVNDVTESFPVNIKRFTKLHRPTGVSLFTNFYMDTEAEIGWDRVDDATYYVLKIHSLLEDSISNSSLGSLSHNYDETNGTETSQYSSMDGNIVISKNIEQNYFKVTDLAPSSRYVAAVIARNDETGSFPSELEFATKSPCSGDFHLFPNTHLSHTLPKKSVLNSTVESCLERCCSEREFECRSISLHITTSRCLLFGEDRNTAPPLAISQEYNHYERKFWKEVSGFQIRSITHNNVAVMNETVQLTLTFVYLGREGCVSWDFGDGKKAFNSIQDTDCSYLCENSKEDGCSIVRSFPNENNNQIIVTHAYDMEDVFLVKVNATDFKNFEVQTLKVAINERGCIYPSITIEDEGKSLLDPKILFRSQKLVLSATPLIKCNNFPGVEFIWGAVSYADDPRTITGRIALPNAGSEILIPPLTFPLGLYRVSVSIEVLDEDHTLKSSDAIYVKVVPSPLVAKIKGGTMRTVGARKIIVWDSTGVSFDPDVKGNERFDLQFNWFCRNYSDDKVLPLKSGNCFDPRQVVIPPSSAGSFQLNTSLLHWYVSYEFSVLVSKGSRSNEFKQMVVVKEGDPPDIYITCVDNCKKKMNPTQVLALRVFCHNCKRWRRPAYKWTLYEVIGVKNKATPSNSTTSPPSASVTTTDDPDVLNLLLKEQIDWEENTTTGSDTPIVVMNKNTLIGGRSYVMRINVTMDGLDGRVFSFSDFDFLTNLPPFGGVCATAPSIGNCNSYIHYPSRHLVGAEVKQILINSSVEECTEFCCLTREFMCLTLSFNITTSQCLLFEHNEDSMGKDLVFHSQSDHYKRLFYRGGAVVDEVVFECRDWKDEGSQQSYPAQGGRKEKNTLTYKFTTLPRGNQTKGLLLYFGNVQTTPGISMGLGNPRRNYSESVIAQVCDVYGECADSNVITLQIVPPSSNNIGDTLSSITSGNASKLAILSDTGSSKAAAQLVQSISSLININEEEDDVLFGEYPENDTESTTYSMTTSMTYTTISPTSASMVKTRNLNESVNIDKSVKTNLRTNVVKALSTATNSVTSIDNLQQMTSAMSSITRETNEIDSAAQQEAAQTVQKMSQSLNAFSDDANKADVTSAASSIVGSLGSVAKASETDMEELKEQMKRSSEIDFKLLDEEDLSPDEFEYYNRKNLQEEKKRVRRNALGSQSVIENAVKSMANTGKALLGKQMEGESPLDISSSNLEMKVEKTSPSELGNRNISTGSGTSIHLPDSAALLGNDAKNFSGPVDMQVTAFTDNPFGFGEDAAFINSPVTMLSINSSDHPAGGDAADSDTQQGIGVSMPTRFDPYKDMVEVKKSINDTGLSISKFEVKSRDNAVLLLIEPDDDRAEFKVLIRLGSKPTIDEFDFKFILPKRMWEVDSSDDLYKIFIPEAEIKEIGIYFVGIKDMLNVTLSPASSQGNVRRRRRSIATVNSTRYHILIATPGCRRFNDTTKKWTGNGCRVDERSTPEVTECICRKLSSTSIFSAEFFVPPNTIDFATVFAKIDISDNPAVFSTVICLVGVYLLMLVWARRKDKKDAIKWSLKGTMDNRKEDNYLYQVSIFTGHNRSASTHSKVSCVIFGENGKSRVRRMMTQEDQHPFTRSSVIHFLIREPKYLGPLTHIHVWHDNSGKGDFRSWRPDQFVIQDIRRGERFFFICDQWLAVDRDDGKVDRILPVATPENMSTFHRLFVSTTTQKFTEDHLWISLFYRPTKSNFTRVQRLACCMALLFMTMIANAMFFERGSTAPKAGTRTLRVGPFTVSPLQIWTSFCSTLLVVPMTTLIMTLFKKAKTKEEEKYEKEEQENLKKAVIKLNKIQKLHSKASTLPEPSDLAGYDAVYQINANGTIRAKPNIATNHVSSHATTSQWPHHCIYIAWCLTWTAVITSGFFAILYSFEWGRSKANRWLSNMMLSFWQSVFIVQPIKVIIFAMFIATIVKKPDHQGLDTVNSREINEVERKFINVCADNIESEIQKREDDNATPPKPPSKRKLRKTRRLREKEKAMSDVIWEVIGYFIYIMVLLFLCHNNRDVKGQQITQQIKNTFVKSSHGLESVTSVENFWRFVDDVLLPHLYPEHWYNGAKKSWRYRNFLTDEQSYRVGPARFRQIRIEERSCPMMRSAKRKCRGNFDFFSEESEDYAPGWIRDVNKTSLAEDDVTDDPTLTAWQHQNWKQLKGVPFVGEISVYPGGGYSAELGVNYKTGQMIVKSLYNHSWINQQTRAVFVEFNLYNPNVNLFTCVQLLVEFPPVGAAVTFTSIMTSRLYSYLGAYGTVTVLAQVVFLFHLLHFTFKIIRALVKLRKKFLRDPWNVYEVIIVITDWSVISLYIVKLVLTNMTLEAFHKNKRKYVNFQQVMSIDQLVGTFLAISAFFGIIRFLKLLRFNRKVGMLTTVLKTSARQWPGFFVMAAVFFIAFIHIGYLVYSAFMEDFKTLISSVETMFGLMMGRPLYVHLRGLYKVFGPVFYFFFCFTAAFLIINILIAIINESYGVTVEAVSKQKNQYEIIDFMIKRFVKWTGIKFLQPQSKNKSSKPDAVSSSQAPLPPLPYKLDGSYRSNIVELQKTMDKYVFDLERKYNKYLNLEELRDEVFAEMEKISERNNKIQKGILMENRSTKPKDQSMSAGGRSMSESNRMSESRKLRGSKIIAKK